MANKKEIKEFLDKYGYTEKDMENFWNENIKTNAVVRALNSLGKTWKDLNITVIEKLPTQKERDEKILLEKAKKENEERLKKEAEKEREKWIEEHFEEYLLGKIDSGEKLDEYEIKEMVYEYSIEEEEGDERRWTRGIMTYSKLLDRYFRIYWERGLTEYQEDSFYEQPEEVKKVEYDKLVPEHYVHVVEWKEI